MGSNMSETLPQTYGKYVLLRRIAMGGMAEIFRAKSLGAEGFEKIIVIKRILPHYTEDQNFVRMFIDEARIASKLQHSNIVQIYDFDQEDDRYYIAMEYVEGCDLKDVYTRGVKAGQPLSPPQVVWIMMEASKGLHYAHVKEYDGEPLNIVHRDVSPHNLMVSFSGEIKLMDFGIAKATQRSTKTIAGTVKGKCAYMSPEQARGKPLDGRSDLFALGIMAWEMLTQKRLFLAESDFETLSNVLKQEVPRPSSINPDVPKALDDIVLKALAKDREQRHASVEAFGRELTKWFYANVDDLDAVAIKPYVRELFKEDIERLRGEYERDKQLQTTEPSPTKVDVELDEGTITTPDQDVEHAQETNAEVRTSMVAETVESSLCSSPDEKTIALPGDEPDAQEAETVHDGVLTRDQLDAYAASLKVDHGGATQALPTLTPAVGRANAPRGTLTGAIAREDSGVVAAHSEPRKAPMMALIAGAIALLLGLGVWLSSPPDDAMTTADGAQALTTTPASTTGQQDAAHLTVIVSPSSAQLSANGKGFDGVATGFVVGDEVLLVAEAAGHRTVTKYVTLSKPAETVTLTLEPETQSITMTLDPGADNRRILVDGQEVGLGVQTYTGEAGSKVVVTVLTEQGTKYLEEVTLNPQHKLVTLKVPQQAPVQEAAMLRITVSPWRRADVKTSKGRVTVKGKTWEIDGVFVGDEVEVSVSRSGFKDATERVIVEAKEQAVKVALERVPIAAGFGTLKVNAKPWAKVWVNGVSKGPTPLTLTRFKSGRHSIRLTKGGQTVTKAAVLKPGDTKQVFHDFSK